MQSSRKKVLLLTKMAEIVGLIGEYEEQPVMPLVFNRLGQCIESC